MVLDVAYVASASNVADRASRKVQRNTYTLPSWFVHWLHAKFTIAAHMFAPAAQPLAPVFATLDDSLGSCGNPWFQAWTHPAGKVFIFPPLRDAMLFLAVARITAHARGDVLLLLPRWTSKNYYQEAAGHATRMWTFGLNCHHAAYPTQRLPVKRSFTLFQI